MLPNMKNKINAKHESKYAEQIFYFKYFTRHLLANN